jgi:hypothetical protein
MKRLAIAIVSASVAALVAASGCESTSTGPAATETRQNVAPTAVFKSYGEPVKVDGATVSVKTILADVSAYEGKPIRVEGAVSKVCERKGCWMEMSDGDKALFVKFTCPVDGRLIPMDAVGKRAVVQGELKIKEISEADARHLAEEGGKTPEQVAKIVGPQKQITLASPGAIVYGLQ